MGFHRPEGAQRYIFDGINTKDVPDVLTPNKYPFASNIRRSEDFAIRTRPGYELLFETVPPGPTITTTCPLPPAEVGVPYSHFLTATGGTAPYTWYIIAGALADGLLLNSLTGEVYGTPTESGTFDVTFQAIGANGGLSSPKACSMEVTADACPGLTGPVVLDFGDVEVFDDVTDQRYGAQVIYDPADYPGQTSARFRSTVVKNNGVYEVEPVLKVVDENGLVYSTPALVYTFVPATGNYEGTVDVLVTLDPVNAHTYYIQVTKTSTGGGAFQVLVPRLWIFLTASDQAKLQYPALMGTSFDLGGSYRCSSAAYVALTSTNCFSIEPAPIFKKEAGKFSQVDYWQILIVADKDTNACAAAWFNKTKNLMVAGTELLMPAGDGITPAVYNVKFSDTGGNNDDGDQFEIRVKRTGVPAGFLMYGHIFVKVGSGDTGYFTAPNLCAEAGQDYLRLGVSDCQDILMDRAYQHNASEWPASLVTYFEGTLDAIDTIYLLDTGTTGVPINPPNNVTSIVFGAGTTRVRSAAIGLTDTHIYTSGGNRSPVFDLATYLIMEISGS